MKIPGWVASAAGGAGVFALATAIKAVRRLPEFDVVATLAALGIVMIVGGLAGLAHHFTRRLILRRPWGAYVYGIVVVQMYLFAVVSCLTVAKLLDVRGVVAPGNRDPFSEWRDWPWYAGLGVVCGLVWGHLSRNEEVPSD